jgi:hypothetical protein
MTARCDGKYVSGDRWGQPCPYRATVLVNLEYAAPFRVCGYHARQYHPDVLYPMDWSLARIREWRLGNLHRLTGAA